MSLTPSYSLTLLTLYALNGSTVENEEKVALLLLQQLVYEGDLTWERGTAACVGNILHPSAYRTKA